MKYSMSHSMNQMHNAAQRAHDHAEAAHSVDRTGWTRAQWVSDARDLMNDVDGSVLSLLNGHVMSMLDEIDDLHANDES